MKDRTQMTRMQAARIYMDKMIRENQRSEISVIRVQKKSAKTCAELDEVSAFENPLYPCLRQAGACHKNI